MNIGIKNQMLDDTELANFKDAIEKYIEKNFIVIPCNNKKPSLRDWSNIQEQDSDEIYEYFRSGKANQIGIRTDDAKYAFQLTEDTLLLTSGHSNGTSVDIAYMHRVATSSISARMQFKNSARDGS